MSYQGLIDRCCKLLGQIVYWGHQELYPELDETVSKVLAHPDNTWSEKGLQYYFRQMYYK